MYSRDHEGLSPLDLFSKNLPANVSYSDKGKLVFVMWSYYMGLSSSVCRHYSLRVITLDNLCLKTTFINISVARFIH